MSQRIVMEKEDRADNKSPEPDMPSSLESQRDRRDSAKIHPTEIFE